MNTKKKMSVISVAFSFFLKIPCSFFFFFYFIFVFMRKVSDLIFTVLKHEGNGLKRINHRLIWITLPDI